MYKAFENNGSIIVEAKDAKKENVYFCPKCNSELILRAGKNKQPHYAHRRKLARVCNAE